MACYILPKIHNKKNLEETKVSARYVTFFFFFFKHKAVQLSWFTACTVVTCFTGLIPTLHSSAHAYDGSSSLQPTQVK